MDVAVLPRCRHLADKRFPPDGANSARQHSGIQPRVVLFRSLRHYSVIVSTCALEFVSKYVLYMFPIIIILRFLRWLPYILLSNFHFRSKLTAIMQNEAGEFVDMYVPRKWWVTVRSTTILPTLQQATHDIFLPFSLGDRYASLLSKIWVHKLLCCIFVTISESETIFYRR